MGKGVTGVRGAGLWGQEAHLGRRRRRWSRLSAGRSRRSRASTANLPRGTLASGRTVAARRRLKASEARIRAGLQRSAASLSFLQHVGLILGQNSIDGFGDLSRIASRARKPNLRGERASKGFSQLPSSSLVFRRDDRRRQNGLLRLRIVPSVKVVLPLVPVGNGAAFRPTLNCALQLRTDRVVGRGTKR